MSAEELVEPVFTAKPHKRMRELLKPQPTISRTKQKVYRRSLIRAHRSKMRIGGAPQFSPHQKKQR